MRSQDNNTLDRPQSKKTYNTPVIQVYGNIRTLTNSVGMVTVNDGMATGNTKTAGRGRVESRCQSD